MVLGPKTINRRSPCLQINYHLHIQEIKPWPPSESLRSLRSVLIHWENGKRNSGFTKPVVPSLEPGFNDGRIEFNESFKLTVAFVRDFSVKVGNGDAFQKNCLEFNLYEPRRDNLKGQLIGTAIIDLADYGMVKEPVSITAPINCKRNFRNMAQSFLYVKIQPLDKGRSSSSSSKGTISKEASLMKNGIGSPSSSMNGEYADEAEIASYTDDDVSSHSSVTVSSSPLEINRSLPHENQQNGSNLIIHNAESGDKKQTIALENGSKRSNVIGRSAGHKSTRGYSSCSSSVDLSSELGDTKNDLASSPASPRSSAMVVPEADADFAGSVDSILPNDRLDEASDGPMKKIEDEGLSLGNHEEEIYRARMHIDASFENMDSTKHVRQVKTFKSDERKLAKIYPTNAGSEHSNSKLQQLKQRMQMLEGELREAAVLEAAIYSVVAEHGGSMTKVHAPARRLYRFYHHTCREFARPQRASAAKSAVSGLVLVSKACGNDVPRLTYWLSNAIVLRAMLSQRVPKGSTKTLLRSNQKEFPQRNMGTRYTGVAEDVEDICTFISESEKVEAWIFSRIVESVWWQTLIPHMQSSAAKTLDKCVSSISSKNSKKAINANHEQVNIALELWKKAFKDACERLCPVRAGGHECGCLPVLRKLIMEECVARLDVAMFNAILWESGDEIPSDPVSDPISDPKVLPIPSGKSSFRAGAQLKNVIGNWSRWLTDFFDMDDDLAEDQYMGDEKFDASFKPFRLLNALSDLMMLPKDMLLDRSIRKQVCPTFGASLIRRILCNFVPDEFCPDPIPKGLLDTLSSEELVEIERGSFTAYPCNAAAPVYSPPPAGVIGDMDSQSEQRKSGSLVLRKQYNSDDELDELELPLASLLINSSVSSPVSTNFSQKSKESIGKKTIRYELLREVWMHSE